MAAVKRTEGQRELDLLFIQTLYVRGDTLRHIARQLNAERPYSLSHQTIANDVNDLLNRWRKAMVEKIDELQAAELLRINGVEREAWEAWERSKDKREKTLAETKTGKGSGKDQRTQITSETLIGDPRFLEKVQWCINKRCEILGLDAPRRLQHTGAAGGPIETKATHAIDLSKCSDEELAVLRVVALRHEGDAAHGAKE